MKGLFSGQNSKSWVQPGLKSRSVVLQPALSCPLLSYITALERKGGEEGRKEGRGWKGKERKEGKLSNMWLLLRARPHTQPFTCIIGSNPPNLRAYIIVIYRLWIKNLAQRGAKIVHDPTGRKWQNLDTNPTLSDSKLGHLHHCHEGELGLTTRLRDPEMQAWVRLRGAAAGGRVSRAANWAPELKGSLERAAPCFSREQAGPPAGGLTQFRPGAIA